MSGYVPSEWTLGCPWCDITIRVGPRGGRGRDQGAGVEAADIMERHVHYAHVKTWAEFLAEGRVVA